MTNPLFRLALIDGQNGIIEAAQESRELPEETRYDEDRIHLEAQFGDNPVWVSGPVDLLARVVLEAALPELLEQVAIAIESRIPTIADGDRPLNTYEDVVSASVKVAMNQGLKSSARIIRRLI